MNSEKRTIQQKLARRKIKRPPAVIYPALATLWKWLYFKKLGVEVTYRADPRQETGPCIVVSNHASRLDYIYTGIPLLPHRYNYVAGYNEFFRSHLAMIFRMLQIIPKKNFTPDVYTIREITRILRGGGRVMLFPEGMSSIGGGNQPCAIGSGKLVKHFAVPVYVARISGGYLTSTKYCLDERPGRVEVVFDRLLTLEQARAMSADEIQLLLDRAIKNDDYAWNKIARVSFDGHGRIAHNLHTLLYRCPKCGKEFTMESSADAIRCKACGNGARLNDKYDLIPFDGGCVIPETPKAWFDWEREKIREEIKDDGFCLSEEVRLGVLPEYRYLKEQKTSEIVGSGLLTVNRSGFTYQGTKNGEPFSFFLPPAQLPTFGMCTDVTRFYTFYEGDFYEFYPQRESVAKWLLTVEENHRYTGGAWKDFPEEG